MAIFGKCQLVTMKEMLDAFNHTILVTMINKKNAAVDDAIIKNIHSFVPKCAL